MLDTDTCIAIIRQRSPAALRKLSGKSVGQIGISSITLSELTYGVARSSRRAQSAAALQDFLLPLELAAYDTAAAECYGEVRAGLTAAGSPIGPLDTLIAAHALSLDVTLVTHNQREFRRVTGLRTEDWIAAART
jgi:tRNA(fMet)-specific endonuclease VapC